MTVLTSLKNPRVSFARKLHRRRVRNDEGAFLIEGPQNVLSAIAGGIEISDLFVDEAFDRGALTRAPSPTAPVVVSDAVMRAISDTASPQGIVAVGKIPGEVLDDLADAADLVLVLAEVRDPGNAGTLVRSARAAGADACVFTASSVDPYGPKTVRASAGALFGLGVVRDAGFAEGMETLRSKGFTILGAAAAQGAEIYDVDLTGPVAIVVGNEAWGFPEDVESEIDQRVSIPMPGPVESLNVAVAGSLLLFEAVRQRQRGPS